MVIKVLVPKWLAKKKGGMTDLIKWTKSLGDTGMNPSLEEQG